MTVRVADVVEVLEAAYPPELAEDWDAVGLVCGDPAEPVRRVLVVVDVTPETVRQAVDSGVDLVVAHHPLLLRGVHGVPADTVKGSLVHRLIRHHVALFCAHTNADAANPGVSDALAAALGLRVTSALRPVGDPGAPRPLGIGRVGELPEPLPFARFVELVAESLPTTAWGVRAAGDAERVIRTVAVSGGAGDSMLGLAAASGVDAYVTADLRHHPASDHLAAGTVPGGRAPALVDVAHWASEWPWCTQAAEVISAGLPSDVEVEVSLLRTDPWTLRAEPSREPDVRDVTG
ncbi:Nif3-like dinuclear metal center hexameric protein [Actinoalloteichus caeruleus]|uniref:Nif3-like dinuclear metal center hexameric protein n=1 Tax=Actinoalloteichus cyanogriseus TaxID=2893586 RepID=UPI003BB8C8FC